MLFKVDLCTLKYQQYLIETDKLTLPSTDGRRTILSNHMPIAIALERGIIETSKDDVLSHFCVNGGVAYFENNFAKVLSTGIIDVNDINIDELNKDRNLAQTELENASNEYRITVANRKIAWLDTQINAYKKYRKD